MAATHIETGSSARPRATFYLDGVATNLDSGVPTVTIKRPDDTTIASGTVTAVGGSTGTYEFTLAALTDPTVLTITWAGPVGGLTQTITTTVEVLGMFLFGLAELRAVRVGGTANAFADTTAWPAATLAARRAEVTDDFAARCGWSFTPRFARETRDGDGSGCLVLDQLKASRLLSVRVNGVAQVLTSYSLRRSGVLEAVSGYTASGFFTPGRQNVTVEYVHGFDRSPPAVSSAGLARAAMLLQPSGTSTASSWTTPDGVTYTYDGAGRRLGSGVNHYGVPSIAEVLNNPSYSAGALA